MYLMLYNLIWRIIFNLLYINNVIGMTKYLHYIIFLIAIKKKPPKEKK